MKKNCTYSFIPQSSQDYIFVKEIGLSQGHEIANINKQDNRKSIVLKHILAFPTAGRNALLLVVEYSRVQSQKYGVRVRLTKVRWMFKKLMFDE